MNFRNKHFFKGLVFFVLIFVLICEMPVNRHYAEAKIRVETGIYGSIKGGEYVEIRKISGKRYSASVPRPGDASHLDVYEVTYKNGNLVNEAVKIVLKKKKLIWKGKNSYTKWSNGTYKYVRKNWY